MTKKKIFVAGATGLAGSGIVRGLLRHLPEAHLIGSYRSEAGLFVDDPRIEYIKVELTNADQCQAAAQDCEMAVLAAAVTGGSLMNAADPWLQMVENTVIDARVVEGLSRTKVERVVFVSTVSVYQPFTGALDEAGLDLNLSPHPSVLGAGLAKRHGEQLCRFWHDKTGLEVAIARPVSLYGPGDKFDPSRSTVVAALARKAVEKTDPFEILGDPEVRRDILHTDDLGDAVAAMLKIENLSFEAFNIGAGHSTSVNEIARFSLAAAKHNPKEIVCGSSGSTVVQDRIVDTNKAQRILNWQSRIPPEEGIRQTVEWLKGNINSWHR